MIDRRAFFAAAAGAVIGGRSARALASNYPRAIANVFAAEGGYSNVRGDAGGPTNFGITLRVATLYAAEFGWLYRAPSVADMRAMPRWFAEAVYRAKYADVVRFDELPPGLDYAVLDYAVHSGVARPPRVLCATLGMPASARVTDAMIERIAGEDLAALINGLDDERAGFLTRLSAKPSQQKFREGWLKRVHTGRAIALDMAGLRPRGLMRVPLERMSRVLGRAPGADLEIVLP